MKKSDLKPCPMCGGKNLVLEPTQSSAGGKGKRYFVRCNDCGVSTEDGYGEAKDMVIARWNRRREPLEFIRPTPGVKHCPFCGYRADIIETTPRGQYWIRCANMACHARTFYTCDDKEKAAEAWNKRG